MFKVIDFLVITRNILESEKAQVQVKYDGVINEIKKKMKRKCKTTYLISLFIFEIIIGKSNLHIK